MYEERLAVVGEHGGAEVLLPTGPPLPLSDNINLTEYQVRATGNFIS
jgi:hypothetical protein